MCVIATTVCLIQKKKSCLVCVCASNPSYCDIASWKQKSMLDMLFFLIPLWLNKLSSYRRNTFTMIAAFPHVALLIMKIAFLQNSSCLSKDNQKRNMSFILPSTPPPPQTRISDLTFLL